MNKALLKPILDSPDLPKYIEQLKEEWEAEQSRRHEFWADVDESRKAEFIQGEIIYHSPVYGRHWMISTNLVRRIVPFVYDHRLGKVAIEKVMVRMTRNDYEPDICFWKQETANSFGQKQSAFPPPDFIVEILSDGTKHRDRGIKFEDYARHGVTEYWIVDPDELTIEQYLLHEDSYQLSLKLKEGIIRSIAISGFEMALEEVFRVEE